MTSTDRTFSTLRTGGSFFESPRWHQGRWFISDFYRHVIEAIEPDGTTEEIATVPGQPSGMGWTPNGDLRVVSMTDNRLLEVGPNGSLEEVADLSAHSGGPTNDLVMDGSGRAYVGNFGFDLMTMGDPKPATLVRVDLDGAVAVVADDLLFPNGAIITPDGSTLLVGETMGARYRAYDIADDGSLSNDRVWAQLADTPAMGSFEEVLGGLAVAPDGCTFDAENHIWAADALGARAIRISPSGEIVDEIQVPSGLGIFACMLGGNDGRTLLLCTAPDFFEHNRAPVREAELITTTVEIPHAGLP